MNRWIIVMSALWGVVILITASTLLYTDQSISYSALANAAGSSAWEYLLVFLLVAFGAWAIPTAVLWQLGNRFRHSPWLAGSLVVLGVLGFLFLKPVVTEPEQAANSLAGAANTQITAAGADEWQCRNDLEISCSGGRCEVAGKGESTPMSVEISKSGSMSVCAYSGCWAGRAEVVSTDDFLVLIGAGLAFSTAPDSEASREDIVVAMDRADGVAVLKAGGFAQPLLCERVRNAANGDSR